MTVRRFYLLWTAATSCLVALFVLTATASAFEIGGTGDLDIDFGEDESSCTIVSIAGFEIVEHERTNERRLIGFVEYGPDEAVEGTCLAAGQLWFDAPVSGTNIVTSRSLDVSEGGVVLGYEEWISGGRTTFEGRPEAGSLEVELVTDSSGVEIVSVDIVLNVLLVDAARDEDRIVDGIMFAGEIAPAQPYQSPTTGRDGRTYVRRTGGGCTGESEVVFVADPYDPYYQDQGSGCDDDPLYDDPQAYDDSSGCESDSSYSSSSDSDSGCESDSSYSSSSDSDSGCESDSSYSSSSSSDSGCESDSSYSSSSDSDSGCESDSLDDGSSSSSMDCEGDDLDDKSASSVAVPMRRLVDRDLAYHLKRTVHFWAPFLFVFLGRRRER